jgi:hypothetical protein
MKWSGSKEHSSKIKDMGTRDFSQPNYWQEMLQFFRDKMIAKHNKDKMNGTISNYDKFTYGDVTKALVVLASHKALMVANKFSAQRTLFENKADKEFIACHTLFGSFSRSYIIAGKQTGDKARFARNCPIGLYAYKEHYGIDYEDWSVNEEEHSCLAIMLGTGLAKRRNDMQFLPYELEDKSKCGELKYLDVIDYRFQDLNYPEFELPQDREELSICRRYAYNRAGGPTNLNLPSKTLPVGGDIENGTLVGILNSSSAVIRDMCMQGHACNSNSRVADAHILHPIKWDYLPRSFDVATTPRLRRL